MAEALLLAIFLASALSLLSYFYCWHDIQTGHPHIISLRQVTNVMDRHKLTRLFGRHDDRYRYHLPPPALKALLKSRRLFFYGEVTADSVCMVGAYLYMTEQLPGVNAGWFIALAGLCQFINFAWSIWLVRRWAHQIREEMDGFGK